MNRLTRQYCKLYESARGNREDEKKFWTDLATDLEEKNVSPRDFSIRGLFEQFVRDDKGDACGRAIMETWKPEGGLALSELEEAGVGAVTTAAFSNITGQIIYNEILDAWNNPNFISDMLVQTVNTSFLDGEKIAGISNVADDAEAIGEAQPYPLSGVTEEYVETPRPVKRGHIIPLTREVIIADRTGRLLQQAATITTSMRINKEKRVLDTVLGVDTTWKYNGSVATATYDDSTTAPHNFDNKLLNDLQDYTDIEEALLKFDAILDPNTGEPVMNTVNQLIVASQNLYTAARILNATQIRSSTANLETLSANPLQSPSMGGVMVNGIELISSPYVGLRATAGSLGTAYWWLGDFRKAFRYMQIWPLSTTQLPSSSEWEFQNDIVRAWKVSEFGVPAVINPRHVLMSTGAS
jgi:hypothetical protein